MQWAQLQLGSTTCTQHPLQLENMRKCVMVGAPDVDTCHVHYEHSYSAGLFENYLNIRFKDPNLEAVSKGSILVVLGL